MEKRVIVRILFDKLDVEKIAALAAKLEETAEEFAAAEVEYNILPERATL